ncbi:MAG: 3-oxoacyl-ACP reductase [Candidatus Marinimicrobia bacterium]|nr:3-oxoacyl-ACP reductase [Candidatus Neomarinimicrobiota bacterium]|tara:strand:- start:2130 stop:2912 length:783 start_codon:yes stop_codon:yes gene_type:complete
MELNHYPKWRVYLFNLNDRVAIVTGASQGIGEAIAKIFAASGAHVICIARNKIKLKNLINHITKEGGSASYINCDITNNETFSNAIYSVLTEFNRLDILVNNAGITRDALLMRMKEEQWDEVLNTNLKAAFHGTKSVIRSMMKNKYGRIINITSIVGLQGNAGQSNYAASKAGLIGFSQSIAKEVGARGITINCIAPGWIETEMTKEIPEKTKSELLKNIPLGRIGSSEDIGYAALFLASEKSKYITGQTITIDGGRLIN